MRDDDICCQSLISKHTKIQAARLDDSMAGRLYFDALLSAKPIFQRTEKKHYADRKIKRMVGA
jgi:hypothetical protein